MFDFLKPDFLNTTNQKSRSDHSTQFNSTLQDTGSAEALIHTVWKDLERMYKLPAGAVECDVMAAPRKGLNPRVWVQLTVLQWSAPLTLHMFAIQNLFCTGLDRYEPGVDHSNVSVVWRFDDQCGCPLTGVADGIDWTGALVS